MARILLPVFIKRINHTHWIPEIFFFKCINCLAFQFNLFIEYQVGFTAKYETAKAGGDVSEVALKTTITERKKKTRKVKKAIIAKAQAAEAEVAAKAKEAEEAKKAAEAKAAEKAKAAEEAKAAKEKPADE